MNQRTTTLNSYYRNVFKSSHFNCIPPTRTILHTFTLPTGFVFTLTSSKRTCGAKLLLLLFIIHYYLNQIIDTCFCVTVHAKQYYTKITCDDKFYTFPFLVLHFKCKQFCMVMLCFKWFIDFSSRLNWSDDLPTMSNIHSKFILMRNFFSFRLVWFKVMSRFVEVKLKCALLIECTRGMKRMYTVSKNK